MLFLLFQVGPDRYALDASRVIKVLPLVNIRKLPHVPKAVAGVFMYRGQPVPVIDLSELTLGRPAAEQISTRIIIVNPEGPDGRKHRLGLIAERATDLLRCDPNAFVSGGIKVKAAPYLGPILSDPRGPIQWVYEEYLLAGPVRQLVFDSPELLAASGAQGNAADPAYL
jgi:chemotaxis-related protein WspB